MTKWTTEEEAIDDIYRTVTNFHHEFLFNFIKELVDILEKNPPNPQIDQGLTITGKV